MLLRYLGYEMSVDEFIEQYLDRQEFELREGELYGPDPTKYFCGSPYDEESFGCYAPVITQALKKAIGEMYEVLDLTGTEIKTLQTEYIDKGMPVILWACINMREPITGPQWKLKDSGEVFTWISNEHCMLLVGYDEEGYYFNDPYENNGVIRYPKENCRRQIQSTAYAGCGSKKEIKKDRSLLIDSKSADSCFSFIITGFRVPVRSCKCHPARGRTVPLRYVPCANNTYRYGTVRFRRQSCKAVPCSAETSGTEALRGPRIRKALTALQALLHPRGFP